jgi:hypothetical protein
MNIRDTIRWALAAFCLGLFIDGCISMYYLRKVADEIKHFTFVQFKCDENTEVLLNGKPIEHRIFLSTKHKYHIVFKRNGDLIDQVIDYTPDDKMPNVLCCKSVKE